MRLSFRHYYFRWMKNLFYLFVLFVAMMTIARGTFAFVFGDFDSLINNQKQLWQAMWLGMRFDLMPLAYISAIPFLLLNIAYLLPGKFPIRLTRFLIISILAFGYFTLAWIFVSDYSFYSYFQDHLNILFFGLFEDDTIAVIISIWKNYNALLWLSIIFVLHYAFYRLLKFLFSPFEFDLRVKPFDWRMPVTFILGSVFLALCARGNFTRLPLSIEDAHISTDDFINKISINGPLSLNRAIKIRKTFGKSRYDYLNKFGYKDWKDAFQDALSFKPKNTGSVGVALKINSPVNTLVKENPPHVVLVVMESMGTFWDDMNSESFNLLGELNGHYQKGLLFKNFLPAENGTIGSIVSIATSQVIRPGARYLSESEFMNLALPTAANQPYKKSGYETHFIYGGKLGWRDLGKYLRVQGFDKLWGADEIKENMVELSNLDSRELGNEWGIFDEYLYSFIEEQLRTATQPQFILVLTTTNHPPFEYPTSYKPLPLKLSKEVLDNITINDELALKRFSGLQYANQKVGEFLTRIKSSPSLNDKTVVAITGDHSFWIAKGVGLEEEFKRYAVPFFISVPERLMPEKYDNQQFGSHEDIFPTLYHLTLSQQNYSKMGENLLTEDSKAMNGSGLVANKHGAYHHKRFWKWKDRKQLILEPSEETPELLKLKKHQQGMIGLTDVYLKEEMKRTSPAEGNDRP